MRINVTNLRSFMAVAECGGFTPAAERLGVAQPTLTRQVKELEERHHIRLFERTSRRINLTPAGEQLLEFARRVFTEVEATERFLDERTRRGVTIYSVATERLADLIAFIHNRMRIGAVDVAMKPSALVYDALLAGTCDVGLLTVPEGAREVDCIEIGRYPVLALVARNHPLRRQRPISLCQLEEHPVIVPSRSAQTRLTFDREVRRLGLRIRILQEIDDADVVRAMALSGYAVGIVGFTGRGDSSESEGLPFEEDGMSQPLHLAVGPRERRSQTATALFALARSALGVEPSGPTLAMTGG